MSKITVNNLSSLQNEITALSVINGNDTKLAAAFDNTLSRDGTSPNQMLSNLDMNSYQVLNLPAPGSDNSPIRKIDLTNVFQVTNLLHANSVSTITIGLGSKVFITPSGLGFFPGEYVLIQVTGDTTRYMVCRVVSYSGSTLSVTALTSAGTGTFSNWTIDISGAVGSASVVYDTVVNAQASSIDPTLSFLNLSGYYTVGDGGNGVYQRVVSQPTDAGKFQSVDGSWWHLINKAVSPEMFGCKGDGSTDDYLNLQNCIAFASLGTGGMVNFTPRKNYRVVITTSTPNFGLVLNDNVTLNLNSSKISMELNGVVTGLRIGSHTRIYGPGKIAVTSSTGITVGRSSNYIHTVIFLGGFSGGTVASPDPFLNPTDWIIDGVSINSVTTNTNGLGIWGFGGPNHGVIRNCIFETNNKIFCAIGFDWNGVGTLSSANINTSRANYNAGTAYTVHPNNILIEDNYMQALTQPFTAFDVDGSRGVRLSGCYDVTIRNNVIDSVTFAGIINTGGDLGFEFSPTSVRYNACKDIVIENNDIKFSFGYGIVWDAFPDNVYDAVVNPANPSYPYSAIGVTDGYNNNSVIRGNTLLCPGITSTLEGIFVSYTRGLTVCDNYIAYFAAGVRLSNGSRKVTVERNDISLSQRSGIELGDSTSQARRCRIISNNCYRNVVNGNSNFGNIYVSGALQALVEGNTLGEDGEDNAFNGIVVTDFNQDISIINNYVFAVKTGGTAFKLPSASTTGLIALWVFRDNEYTGTGGTYTTGLTIIPYQRNYSPAAPGILVTHAQAARGALSSDLTPSYGTWGLGSTILNIDSINTGEKALVKCVATGTPGTWKTMVTLP